MRLGILIYSLSGGGAERVVSYLVSYCVKNNIDVHLILMNTTITYKIPETTKIHYLETSKGSERGIKKALKIPILAFKYAKLVKKLKLTHSLSFLTRPAFINILAGKLKGYKFKIITNERAFPSLQYSYKGFQSSFNKTLIKVLYKKSDLVISNSYGNAGDLVDNFEVPQHKMKVIHNPIDISKIEKSQPNTTFFNEDTFNMITLGRLDIGKNHNMLIEAVYKTQNPLVRLYIFGVGDLHDAILEKIETLDLKEQVFLMGFSEDPYQYLKTADLFIFGSNHEGFPNVLLEAMACGLPILSTNCKSGPSEIMELDTEKEDLMLTDYGILVPIKDATIMARGISYFIDNEAFATQCSANSEKRIKAFEKNTILEQYINLIKSTCTNK